MRSARRTSSANCSDSLPDRYSRSIDLSRPESTLPKPRNETILSRDEVARLIESASNPFHRTIRMTLYATGVRRAELARLKLTDVDAARMVLHVHNGKGRKDRDVVLSPRLLEELRQHYRRLARKPATWLFPGGQRHTADNPVSAKVCWNACREAAKRAGIRKALHPHTLRHCFATHLWSPAPTCAPSRFSSATAI
jgi:integrase/recombinase XerD